MNKSKKTIQRKIGGVARQHRNSWDVRRGMSTIDKFQPPSAQVRHSAVNPHQHFLTVFSSLLSLHRPISCFLCLSTVTVLSLCLYSFSCSIFHLIIKYAFLALAQFKIRNPWGLLMMLSNIKGRCFWESRDYVKNFTRVEMKSQTGSVWGLVGYWSYV